MAHQAPTTDLNDSLVRIWGLRRTDNVNNIAFGLDIETNFEWSEMQGSTDIYFHNE